jgi:hypothetical protein
MKTLLELNATLLNMTANNKLIKSNRATAVNDIIKLVINETKEHSFKSKKIAQKYVLSELLSDENIALDNYTKRAIKVSYAILIDGYKIKKESLTLSQAENLVKCNKDEVNNLMELSSEVDGETGESDYSIGAKALIKEFSKAKAIKELETLKALEMLETLKTLFGMDTKKVLNKMVETL